MHHIFRYDDYSGRSSAAVEDRLFASLAEHHLACTVAVIPMTPPTRWDNLSCIPLEPIDRERLGRLRRWVDLGVVEPALHGYCHVAFSPVRGITEVGMRTPRDQQRRLIADGRTIVEDGVGCPVGTFVPPWNGYSAETIDVLIELGFTNLSAGFVTHETKDALSFLPITSTLEGTFTAMTAARRWDGADAIVVTNLHDYDFADAGFGGGVTWKVWDAFIHRLAALPDVTHSTIGGVARGRTRDLSAARLAANARMRQRASTRIGRLALRNRHGVYWSTARADAWSRPASW
jgi:hypothetical protein